MIAVKTMMLWCFSILNSTTPRSVMIQFNFFLPGFDCVTWNLFTGPWGCFVDLWCFNFTCQVTQIGSDHVVFNTCPVTFRCDIKQLPGPSAICPSEDAAVTCLHFEHVVLLVSPGFILCIYIYTYIHTYTYT